MKSLGSAAAVLAARAARTVCPTRTTVNTDAAHAIRPRNAGEFHVAAVRLSSLATSERLRPTRNNAVMLYRSV